MLFDLTLQPRNSLAGVDDMDDQEPSVDHNGVPAVGVITEEVEMSHVVSLPLRSTTVSADHLDHVPVTEPLQLPAAGPSVDDGVAIAAAAMTSDEEDQLEQLENVQVAIKVCVINECTSSIAFVHLHALNVAIKVGPAVRRAYC